MDDESTTSGAALSPVVDLFREFMEYAARKSRSEFGRAAGQGRVALELRQTRRDRRTRLEKLGREVIALIEAGEVNHPGLIKGAGKVAKLDARIEDIERQGFDGHEE